jgi:eukaryotic-like serine/threonine-protein kinase
MYIACMSKHSSNNGYSPGRSWASSLLPLLAALSLAVLGRISILENGYYDHLQQRQHNRPTDKIMLLTVNPRLENQSNIWAADEFLPLARRLKDAGAHIIVPIQPLSFPEAPSQKQITAIEALQAHANQTDDIDVNPLTRDLPLLKARYHKREKTLADYQSINNIILAAELTDSYSSSSVEAPACDKFNASIGDIDVAQLRRSRNIVMPIQDICKSVNGVGFASFYPDDDDVVRSSNLLINANGALHSSLALATLASVERAAVSVDSDKSILLNRQLIGTDNGFRVFNQFYPDYSLFTVGYNEIIANPEILENVRDKIVLIGEAKHTGMPGYATPIADKMTPLQMTAMSLSNLLQRNYITRPDWLPIAETLLLVALIVACLTILPRMGWLAGITVGLSIGVILMMLEAWLITQHLIWMQLASISLYVTVAVFLVAGIGGVNRGRRHRRDIGIKTLMAETASNTLDVQLSMLRQEQPNAVNKRKIYDIALQCEQTRQFAKAENALRHLAKVDPNYMDVAKKLLRISGASNRQKAQTESRKMKSAQSSGNDNTLGRYQITKTLGRGAMSTVYLGIDSKIQRKVAIKTIALADEFDESELQKARQQFLREAESAGRLNHPDIVAIYDIGEDNNVAYLAMEYFSGRPLIEYARKKKLLPPVRVMQLIARTAEALDYAHSQGVVHRDIKPANILYDAATDRLKVTDFGIARLTDTSRTKTGIILGTPSYMSPEQLSASDVDGLSDLYSLGVTLYHLLTGAPPFRGDSIPQLMDKIIHDAPPKITQVRPDLPECLDIILAKAMAKNSQDRFSNGKAMALALLACSKQVRI